MWTVLRKCYVFGLCQMWKSKSQRKELMSLQSKSTDEMRCRLEMRCRPPSLFSHFTLCLQADFPILLWIACTWSQPQTPIWAVSVHTLTSLGRPRASTSTGSPPRSADAGLSFDNSLIFCDPTLNVWISDMGVPISVVHLMSPSRQKPWPRGPLRGDVFAEC